MFILVLVSVHGFTDSENVQLLLRMLDKKVIK